MKISILGCGWLGFSLAKYLKLKGNIVKGTTTNVAKIQKLEKAGIEPFLISLDPQMVGNNIDDFLDCDILIINIPPRIKKSENFHELQIGQLLNEIKLFNKSIDNLKIIYVSSTSVYLDINHIVKEDSPIKENFPLYKVEKILQNNFANTAILRCGGLMGYDRFPGKYYANTPILTGNIGVNYIHRDDVLLIIEHIIDNNLWNNTFNAVATHHPLRKDIILKNCIDLGLELPIFMESINEITFKIVDSGKLLSTNYQFKYPNPMDFYYQKEK